MERVVRVFRNSAEADRADAAYYASLTPQERVDLLLTIIARHRETLGEAAQGFEVVCRVIDLEQS